MRRPALLIMAMLLCHVMVAQPPRHTITVQARFNEVNGKPAEGITWRAVGHEVYLQHYSNGYYELVIHDAAIGQVIELSIAKEGYVVINPDILRVSLLNNEYHRTPILLLCKPQDVVYWSRINAQREVLQRFPGLASSLKLFSPMYRQSVGGKPSKRPDLQKLEQQTDAWFKTNNDIALQGRQLNASWLKFAESFLYELNIDSSLYCFRKAVLVDSTNRGLLADLVLFEYLKNDNNFTPLLAKTLALPIKNDDDSLLHALLQMQQGIYEETLDSASLRDHPAPLHRWKISDSALLARYWLFYGLALLGQEDETYTSWLQQGLALCEASGLHLHQLLCIMFLPDTIGTIEGKEKIRDSMYVESLGYLKDQYMAAPNSLHTLIYYLLWFEYAEVICKQNTQEFHDAIDALINAIKDNGSKIHTVVFKSTLDTYTEKAFPNRLAAITWLQSQIVDAERLQGNKQHDYDKYLAYLYEGLSAVLHDSISLRKKRTPEMTDTEQQVLYGLLAKAETHCLNYLTEDALIDPENVMNLGARMIHVGSCLIKDSLHPAVDNVVNKLPKQVTTSRQKKIYSYMVTSLYFTSMLDSLTMNKLIYKTYPLYKELYVSGQLNSAGTSYYLAFMVGVEEILHHPRDKNLVARVTMEKYAAFKKRSDTNPSHAERANHYATYGLWPYWQHFLARGQDKKVEQMADSLLQSYLLLAQRDSAYYNITEKIYCTPVNNLLQALFIKDTAVLSRWTLRYKQVRKTNTFYQNNGDSWYHTILDRLSGKMEYTLLQVLKHTRDTDSLIRTMHILVNFIKDDFLPLRKENQKEYNKTEISDLQLKLADYYAVLAGYALQQQNLSLAAMAIDSSLAYEPQNSKALIKKAHWHLYTGNYEEALRIYKQLKDKPIVRREIESAINEALSGKTKVSCYDYFMAELGILAKQGFTHKYEKELASALTTTKD